MTMSGGRLALHPDFGLDARREFSETARAAITRNEIAGSEVELDCSCIEVVGQIDDPVIGMLVTLARAAQRQGARVALVNAPRPMREQLEAAEFAHFFDWRG